MVSTYQFISGVVRHTLSETGQHQILPLFNLEQGAPVSQASAKTTGLLDICRRDFFFFSSGCISPALTGSQSKRGLCSHFSFPLLTCVPPARLPRSPAQPADAGRNASWCRWHAPARDEAAL